MPVHAEQRKHDAIDAAAALVRDRLDPDKRDSAERFLRHFYANVPPADMLDRDAEDLFGAAVSLWQFAAERSPVGIREGRPKVRAFAPKAAERGWRSPHTVVEIVNDDMPFLVDSVTAALHGLDLVVHLVIHPVADIMRDAAGRRVDQGQAGTFHRESLMHIEISETSDAGRLALVAATLEAVLRDVRAAVADWLAMRERVTAVVAELAETAPAESREEVAETAALLDWLNDNNFTFLGYREYHFDAEHAALDVVADAGLGQLRDASYSVFDGLRNFSQLPPELRQFLDSPQLMLLSKSNRRGTVHRAVSMDTVLIKTFGGDAGQGITGLKLFMGLFTSMAYSRSPSTIPLLRRKIQRTIERSGFTPSSHDGKALTHILDTFPRSELFQISEEELLEMSLGILHLQERQRIALFVRRDPFGRWVSCLVYVPRDRYDTELRGRMSRLLEREYGGHITAFNTQLDESVLARVHFIVSLDPPAAAMPIAAEVERRLVETGRNWADVLAGALVEEKGEETAIGLQRRYGAAFPTAYRERFLPHAAVSDIDRIEAVLAGQPLGMALYRPVEADEASLRFKIYKADTPVALSDILPMLEAMNLRVISELPYEVSPREPDRRIWIHEFLTENRAGTRIDLAAVRTIFEDAFARVWAGEVESDGFNRLVLLAGLDARQIVILRALAKFLRQTGSTFSQAYMEETLANHAGIARLLVRLFEQRFDPAAVDRDTQARGIAVEIEHALDAVANLDEDRILRSFLTLVVKAVRTNHFQPGADGRPKGYLSIKIASREIDFVPAPRPLYEIWVYSPWTEAVHLRGGKVARGGIRWSDRKEDFRTEVLGLMKAQTVKNAVIVPVGSKGGFVVKRPPAGGREALMAEVVHCYKTLMRGMLDITDSFEGERVRPPADVVRHDGDDPYLVVAADKGTATFSDIANGVAIEYGFWLGDAFASGGSAGYDHKAMGITARGAWEAVKRHFRELGRDIQSEDFTTVGVGDMSGDVFGNGMLLSRHIRLVGAFNHQHIFLDPEPDPAAAWAERKRLFDLPRSSWADYRAELISAGGGVFDRAAKSIRLTPEVKARFGIARDQLTPAELIQVLLRAEIDLLWFGGIGTYVKARGESSAEVGDRANDMLRIDASEIRAKVVGEGANLGVTQRGRIEYGLGGGRINTDAIDNSAGVDTSDHEVNIKILVGTAVDAGDMTVKQRDGLLAQLTDEVAELVLRDNYLQTQAITVAETQGLALLDQEIRLMRSLERAGRLDRALEFLPDDETLTQRAAAKHGMTRPEIAVLLAYAKMALYDALLPSDLPDDPDLGRDLLRYFPKRLVDAFPDAVQGHRLRREIIATFVTNSLVNRAGPTFVNEMQLETGRGAHEIARAYAICRDVYGLRELWHDIEALDGRVAAALQTRLLVQTQRLVERATLWFLRSGLELDIAERIAEFQPSVRELAARLAEILPAPERKALAGRSEELERQAVPAALAARVAALDYLVSAADIVRIDEESRLDVAEVGRLYFSVGARFGLDTVRSRTAAIPAETPWQRQAVRSLLDDLFGHQRRLVRRVLTDRVEPGAVESWLDEHARPLDPLIAEIAAAKTPDLAMVAVASRQIADILRK